MGYKDPLRTKEYHRKYYIAHRDDVLAKIQQNREKNLAACRAWFRKTMSGPEAAAKFKEKKKWAHARRRYGIGKVEYLKLLEAQGGGCAICGVPPDGQLYGRLHIDHDHASGGVRGLLCFKCNVMLGNANDDVRVLQSAIDYLARG